MKNNNPVFVWYLSFPESFCRVQNPTHLQTEESDAFMDRKWTTDERRLAGRKGRNVKKRFLGLRASDSSLLFQTHNSYSWRLPKVLIENKEDLEWGLCFPRCCLIFGFSIWKRLGISSIGGSEINFRRFQSNPVFAPTADYLPSSLALLNSEDICKDATLVNRVWEGSGV